MLTGKFSFSIFCNKTIQIFIILILSFSIISFGVCNIMYMMSYSDTFSYQEWVWLIPAFLAILLVYLLGKRRVGVMSPQLIGLIISNITFCFFLFSYNTVPVSDWEKVWEAANGMATGNFTDGVVVGTYMHEIPYQLGLAFVESLFIRVFGSHYIVLQMFNLLLLNLITYSVYHFSKRKSSEDVACFAYMASCLFLCWTMTVNQFTNHQLGFIFLYLSLYFFEKDKIGYAVFAGLLAACLNFVRPMGIMVVATILCYTIYRFINEKKYNRPLINLLGFYLSYAIMLFLFDMLLLNLNYTDERVSKSTRNLYHKIAYTTYDSKVDGKLAEFNYDYDAYNEAFKAEMIDKVTNHPQELVIGVANKMCRYLGVLDYEFEMTYNHDESVWKRYPIKALYSTQWFQYLFYVMIALFGYLQYRKKHGIDIYQIFFIGNTLVYIFVEAFSSYRFIHYFYILFLVGYGMNEIHQLLSHRKKA